MCGQERNKDQGGRKVGRAGRENVAVGISLRIVLVACFSLVF